MILPAGTVMCASGVLRLAIAACVLMHQVLLEPDRANYPNARRRVRFAMAVLSLFLFYNGAELIYRACTTPHRGALWSGFWLSVVWLAAEATRLEKVLRSWLPARIQRRVQQLLHIASCKNRRSAQEARNASIAAMWPAARPRSAPSAGVVAPALAELVLGGAHVTAPAEHQPLSFGDALRDHFPPPPDDPGLIPPALNDL